jgi:xanthine dehydrogenase YagR molybdenum-binding subunit
VLVGVQDIGTGTRTVLAQITAEELGVELEAVRVVLGDTLPTPYGPTSSGSQTLPSAGPAVRAAARDCLRQLFGLAAQMMERPGAGEDDLAVQEGQIVYLPEPDTRIPFEDVAHKMDGYTFVGEGARGPNPDEKAINTFGAQFAEVDVNVHTGQVRVRRVVAVHDVGRVINPLTATNQVYGGITQGMGYGTMEGLVFDDGQTGVQLTNSLETYRVPTIADAPGMDVSFVDRADVEANSIGALGLGEPPIIPTPAAILNAIADAIGVCITDLPITPPRVLRALESHREEEGTA